MSNEITCNISLGVVRTDTPFNKQFNKQTRATQTAQGNNGGCLTVLFETGKVALKTSVKPSAKCATTTTLPTNTYANGSSGVGATLTATGFGAFAAVDGVTLVVGDYILVKNQASGLQNGLYKLTTLGDGGTAYVLTRQVSMDVTGEYVGASVYIEGGSTLANTWWCCTNASAPTVGSTSITFSQAASGTVVPVGSVTTPGYLYVQNTDTTNFVQIGPEVGGIMMPWAKLKAGEQGMIRVDSSTIIRALADTANVSLYFELFQD